MSGSPPRSVHSAHRVWIRTTSGASKGAFRRRGGGGEGWPVVTAAGEGRAGAARGAQMHFITGGQIPCPHLPVGHGRERRPPLPGCHGRRPATSRPRATRSGWSRLRACTGAGASPWGRTQHIVVAPAATGKNVDLSPTAMSPLVPFRDYLTIISYSDVHMAEPYDPDEIGGDHFRSSGVFLTKAHPTRPRTPTCTSGAPCIRCTPRATDGTCQSRRCSSALRAWTRSVAARTASRVFSRT